MYILGDIGNTETKIFLVTPKYKIINKLTFLTKSINQNKLEELFSRFKVDYKKLKNVDTGLENLISNLKRQFLHAKILGFIHPKTNEEMIFSSNLPKELNNLLKMLKNTDE